MNEGKIEGQLTPGARGTTRIEAEIKPVKKRPEKEAVEAVQEQRKAEIRKLPTDITKELALKAKRALAKVPKETLGRLPFGIGEKLQAAVDITEEYTDRRGEGLSVLEEYLGKYDQEKGKFIGGVEGKAEEVGERNRAVLEYYYETGEIGYKDFGAAITRLFDVREGLGDSLKKTDDRFRNVNSQGKAHVDLEKLDTRDKRLKWIADSFRIDKDRIGALWTSAQVARHGVLPVGITREQAWNNLIQRWNAEGVTRSEQIVVLGLLQITEANGIQNFLAEGKVKDRDGYEVTTFSLGGDKLKKLETQYYELTFAYLSSISRKEHLLYDPGRGVLVANASLRDRTVFRDALDLTPPRELEERIRNLPEHSPLRQRGLLKYFLMERLPKTTGKGNPWEEMVARAEFETAYWERYHGGVNMAQRLLKERHNAAKMEEIASAGIIDTHWLEKITGFKEALAQYTLASGPDKEAYRQLMREARAKNDRAMIKRLEDTDRYARQFLEMCAAPVGGFYKTRDNTFDQVFNPTVNSRSGPLKERLQDEGLLGLRTFLAKAIRDKSYIHHVRMNEETGQQKVVINVPGLDGEFYFTLDNPDRLTMVQNGGRPLLGYLREHGFYKEDGYWPEWENTAGPGFSAYLKDGIEHATNLLTRANLMTYQKREIGRRLNELYDGSERHKRYFIQFLLERKESLKEQGWLQNFKRQVGVPFNPLDNTHIIWLAGRLGLDPEQPRGELVNKLADPDTWKLYFDPLNESHRKLLHTAGKRELGFDRYFLNVLWAFDGMTELRNKSKTMIEMGVQGVKYDPKEGWVGLTVEDLMKFASEEWKHCKPNETLEVLGNLIQRVNEAYTHYLLKKIRVRNSEITVKMLDDLFTHDIWKVARLTPKERDMVLNEGRFYGEKIELTAKEIQEGRTAFGKALEMKGKRMRLNLYTMLYQSMYLDLVSQPAVPLDTIWALRWQKGWFERCVPDLSTGEVQRLKKNPILFALMPFDDIKTYDFIEEGDPRYSEMVDKVLGVLIEPASVSIKDQVKLSGINARAIDFKNHDDFSRRGWYLGRVMDRMGITNLTTPNLQFEQYARALGRIEWIQNKGRYVGLPHCVIEFAKDKYRLDITDVQAVEKMGGQQFLEQFTEIVRDSRRLLHVNYGLPPDPRRWPGDYEVWYKWMLGPLAGGFNESKEYQGPDWWQDIPTIVITDKEGHKKEVCAPITYKDALRGLHRKFEREPLFGPWPDYPMPHVERDKKAILEASFFNCEETKNDRGETVLRASIGKQMAQVVDWMKELTDLPEDATPAASLESRFYPQLERYALIFMRTINVNGERVFLDELNIKKYTPQVIAEFKRRMTEDNDTKRGNYNLGFVREFLAAIYGLDCDIDSRVVNIRVGLPSVSIPTVKTGEVKVRGRTIVPSITTPKVTSPFVGVRFQNKKVEISASKGSIDTLRDTLQFMYAVDSGDAYNFKTFTEYIEYLRDTMPAFLAQPETPEIPECWKGDNRIVSRWYLRNLADELQYGVEGPSVLYELIDTAMQRNLLYYKDVILRDRARWFGMSSQEKMALLNKLKDLADQETVLLNDEKGIKCAEGVYEELKRYGFKSPAELAVFIGALQVHDKGLETLRKLLFTNNPWELQAFLAPETRLKSFREVREAFGKKDFWLILKQAIPEIGLKFLISETGRGLYYAQRYDPEIGPATLIKPFLGLLGEGNPLLSLLEGFEKSIFYPRQSFRIVLIPTLFFTQVGPELLTAIQGLTAGSFGIVATSIEKIFEIPGAVANLETYWKGLQGLTSSIPAGQAMLFYFGTGIALNLRNELIISPLLAKVWGIHTGSKEEYDQRIPHK